MVLGCMNLCTGSRTLRPSSCLLRACQYGLSQAEQNIRGSVTSVLGSAQSPRFRSLRLHDHRSRVLDSPPQRCVSYVPWVYLVNLQ